MFIRLFARFTNSQHPLLQFSKFAFVGALNSAIDLFILNVLSAFFRIYSGFFIILFNLASFSVAVLNSYYLNKRWTFQHAGVATKKEFTQFYLVNVGGVVINTAIVFVITTFIPTPPGLHPQVWLNVGKIVALPAGALWNFLCFRFLIFRER
ncbi:MAG: hypothetical protein COU08_02585 [Candidatus Harrisonbacteria bacterium CG10_big_fil_rev_8_21_14_0_10_42_17]|uniref:GtrA/DPMS transmembrane domain-containing protein n=1 Tax=Candidatus Harrisonbacteria bacterium CG10_big_fil_rev_8_21_14_0_10_42_17 TaxID=1974584 RepID=A0A2M6WHV0_9BACT|nr:MAG: hypothetical protein COU08_02585 [Candidatus Harrisonbacteria bacterium CG10_big_fil_rev_8_21_14_0_10_42_17]